MKNIKMIVTDLDRTLLHKHNSETISDYTAGILNKCRQNGIKIVFATARPKRVTLQFLEYVPADALIMHNGAVIYIGDEQIFHCGISHDTAKNIVKSISRDFPEATIGVESNEIYYMNFEAEYDESVNIWNYTIINNKLYEHLPDKLTEKIIIGLKSLSMTAENVFEYFPKYLSDDLYLEIDTKRFVMIMNRKAKKSLAVKFLAERYGYNITEVLAFGDDYNDVEMIKECGVGVAVSNAIDEAKAAADYICDTNDNDGVAKWLEENIL